MQTANSLYYLHVVHEYRIDDIKLFMCCLAYLDILSVRLKLHRNGIAKALLFCILTPLGLTPNKNTCGK